MDGYYFTKRENDEMLNKGYEVKLCKDLEERNKLAEEYKSKGYFVRKAFDTTMVRGIYSYYLWLKKKPNKPEVKNGPKKDYDKILKDSVKRVMPYIKKIVKKNELTINEPEVGYKTEAGGRLGFCRAKHIIKIDTRLLDSEVQDDIDSVVAHEITHCIKECKGHDKTWKSVMKQINEIAPFKIEQFSNNTINNNEVLHEAFKYLAKCKDCGKVHYTGARESWRTRYYQRTEQKCSCGGKIEMRIK